MQVQNTCSNRVLYVTAGGHQEEIQPSETKVFVIDGGVTEMTVGTTKSTSQWQGFVPTDDKKPLLVGYNDAPYVTHADNVFPNCSSGGMKWLWILLIVILMLVVGYLSVAA